MLQILVLFFVYKSRLAILQIMLSFLDIMFTSQTKLLHV